MNPDGTPMTVEDYLKAVKKLQTEGELPIAGFGLENHETYKQIEEEKNQKVSTKKDFWTSINNAKRIIPKYAREERE